MHGYSNISGKEDIWAPLGDGRVVFIHSSGLGLNLRQLEKQKAEVGEDVFTKDFYEMWGLRQAVSRPKKLSGTRHWNERPSHFFCCRTSMALTCEARS